MNHHQKWQMLRSRLIRQCVIWGILLPMIALALSIAYMDRPEQWNIISAFSVAAGFISVSVSVRPAHGTGAAFFIFIGSLLGSIAFSWTIAVTVAVIGIVKLKRLDQQYHRSEIRG